MKAKKWTYQEAGLAAEIDNRIKHGEPDLNFAILSQYLSLAASWRKLPSGRWRVWLRHLPDGSECDHKWYGDTKLNAELEAVSGLRTVLTTGRPFSAGWLRRNPQAMG